MSNKLIDALKPATQLKSDLRITFEGGELTIRDTEEAAYLSTSGFLDPYTKEQLLGLQEAIEKAIEIIDDNAEVNAEVGNG